jgi:hypothetical protein
MSNKRRMVVMRFMIDGPYGTLSLDATGISFAMLPTAYQKGPASERSEA